MINLCVYGVPPSHVYKGWREEEVCPHRARQKCGVLLGLPSPSRIPPPTWNRKKGREKEKEGRGLRESWIRGCPDGRTIPSAGLLDYEDTRLKTPSRVRKGLSLAWKASLAMLIFRSPTIVTDFV